LCRLITKSYPSVLSDEAKQDMLIKQFFDGIEDDEAKYYVKYLMQPRGLQEAVDRLREYDSYKGIKRDGFKRQGNYGHEETTRLPNNFVRAVYKDVEEDLGEEAVRAVNERQTTISTSSNNLRKPMTTNSYYQNTEIQRGRKEVQEMQKVQKGIVNEIRETRETLKKLVQLISNGDATTTPIASTSNRSSDNNTNRSGRAPQVKEWCSYECDEVGHFARECPTKQKSVMDITIEDEESQLEN
jgi:hypothetical protein